LLDKEKVRMRRLSRLFGSLALIGLLALSLGSTIASAQETTDISNHPLIGAWFVTSHPEGAPASQNTTSLLPGGVVLTSNLPVFPAADANSLATVRSLGQGSWTPVDDKTVAWTFLVLVTDAEGGNPVIRTVSGQFTIDDTGNAFTGVYQATVSTLDGTVISVTPGTADGTRILVQPIDISATPVAGS
jgi:hypothetical protein